MYADFDYYKTKYRGVAIPVEDFDRLALRASERVDFLTKHRAARYAADVDRDPVARATCAIAEVLQQAEKAGAPGANGGSQQVVVSETVGKQRTDYSKFAVTNSAGQNVMNRQIQNAAALHLHHTGLLYRGVW